MAQFSGASLHRQQGSARVNGQSIGEESGARRGDVATGAYAQTVLQDELEAVATASAEQRDDALNKAAYSLGRFVGGGSLDAKRVEAELVDTARIAGVDEDEALSAIRSSIKAGRSNPRSVPDQEGKAIFIREDNMAEVADRCEEILADPGLPQESRIFQRGGKLVRAVTLPAADFDTDPSNSKRSAAILEVTRHYLLDILSRYARFTRFDRRTGRRQPCNPPKEVAEIVLARKGFWKVPVLRGVLNCPTLRADGTVIAAPGYDQISGYFLAHSLRINLADEPSAKDVQNALKKLINLLSGFSFVGDEDRSVALSLIMTSVIRSALDCAPLSVISATTRGSGKSTLADICSAISQGRRSTVLSSTTDREEFEKRLTGCLIGGDPMVNMDNINGTLESDLLCQAVTSESLRIRPLGGSGQIEIPNTALFCANGNNLTVSGDLARRTILCKLDPGLERPEERTFPFDPVALALATRTLYVEAVLTIVRGYLAAGKPNMGLTPFGSFERWSALVRSPLVWAGMVDPCKSRVAVIEGDPDAQLLKEMLVEWHKIFGRTPKTVKEVIGVATADHDGMLYEILDAIAGDRSEINARRLGHWLKRNIGRIANGLRVEQHSSSSRVHWKVIPVGSGHDRF